MEDARVNKLFGNVMACTLFVQSFQGLQSCYLKVKRHQTVMILQMMCSFTCLLQYPSLTLTETFLLVNFFIIIGTFFWTIFKYFLK